MGYRDKIEESLEVETSMGAPEALQAARRVIEDIGSVRTWRLRIVSESDDAFEVAIKPTVVGALGDPTHFVVSATGEDGNATLDVRVSRYSVYQEKLLWLIPVGPKSVPGMAAYKKCIEALRGAFSA